VAGIRAIALAAPVYSTRFRASRQPVTLARFLWLNRAVVSQQARGGAETAILQSSGGAFHLPREMLLDLSLTPNYGSRALEIGGKLVDRSLSRN
jgi:hypothetical protein